MGRTDIDPFLRTISSTGFKLKKMRSFEAYESVDCSIAPTRGVHYHDCLEIGYCLFGHGVVCMDGQIIPYCAPCVTVFHPGQLHTEYAIGTERSRWLFVQLKVEELFSDNPLVQQAVKNTAGKLDSTVSHDAMMVAVMQEVEREYDLGEKTVYQNECLYHLFATLLLRCDRLYGQNRTANRHELSESMARVLEYINAHHAEAITVDDISRALDIHPVTLRQRFKRAFGITPMQYIRQMKISAVCALLAGTDRPITEIASSVGYDSLSTFNRNFYDVCGCSPTAYRKFHYLPNAGEK